MKNLAVEIACVCDLLNTWARELGVEECVDPYKNLNLKKLVDRIWMRVAQKMDVLHTEIEKGKRNGF